MLGVCKKNYISGFFQVMGVYSVFVGFRGHSALQSFKCVCVECGHTCAHTIKAHFSVLTLGTAVLSSLYSGAVDISCLYLGSHWSNHCLE